MYVGGVLLALLLATTGQADGRHARAMADTQACLVADPLCQTCKTSTFCAICKDSTLPNSETGKCLLRKPNE
ncbi:H-type lectin domain [Micractinium conductrix]|uniref:H-type lectin domain n=1 Tax=Micractinium conductrix TaxID=554055 RepID=A0A2P6VI72_9CHLO|nr:H-type lectin domain [Micractinium conductrix]|eukprot:PSC73784.1 H-type lectin domain [Micractinium conductrix]